MRELIEKRDRLEREFMSAAQAALPFGDRYGRFCWAAENMRPAYQAWQDTCRQIEAALAKFWDWTARMRDKPSRTAKDKPPEQVELPAAPGNFAFSGLRLDLGACIPESGK